MERQIIPYLNVSAVDVLAFPILVMPLSLPEASQPGRTRENARPVMLQCCKI